MYPAADDIPHTNQPHRVSFFFFSIPNSQLFVLREEAEIPGGNPRRQSGNVHSAQRGVRPAGFKPTASMFFCLDIMVSDSSYDS